MLIFFRYLCEVLRLKPNQVSRIVVHDDASFAEPPPPP